MGKITFRYKSEVLRFCELPIDIREKIVIQINRNISLTELVTVHYERDCKTICAVEVKFLISNQTQGERK